MVGESGSFWLDLFITIIGTLLGFWGALYLTDLQWGNILRRSIL